MTDAEKKSIKEMVQTSGFTVLDKCLRDQVEALTGVLVDHNDDDARGMLKGIKWVLRKIENSLKTPEGDDE